MSNPGVQGTKNQLVRSAGFVNSDAVAKERRYRSTRSNRRAVFKLPALAPDQTESENRSAKALFNPR